MRKKKLKFLQNIVLKELKEDEIVEFVVSLVHNKEVTLAQRMEIKDRLSPMTLHEFLIRNDSCVDIYVDGFEYMPASTECMSSGFDMFTEEGKEQFSKFLNATVIDPYEHLRNRGIIHILIGGTKETNDEYLNNNDEDTICEEIQDFLYAMAGHISASKYDRWFKDEY
jgi:hypothetical protein